MEWNAVLRNLSVTWIRSNRYPLIYFPLLHRAVSRLLRNIKQPFVKLRCVISYHWFIVILIGLLLLLIVLNQKWMRFAPRTLVIVPLFPAISEFMLCGCTVDVGVEWVDGPGSSRQGRWWLCTSAPCEKPTHSHMYVRLRIRLSSANSSLSVKTLDTGLGVTSRRCRATRSPPNHESTGK